MITVITDGEHAFPIDADASIEVENLKALLEADTSIPAESQQLICKGVILSDGARTLSSYGVGSDDLVLLRDRRASLPSAGSSSSSSASTARQNAAAATSLGPAPTNEEEAAEQLRQQILADPNTLAQLRANKPELADAVTSKPARFLELVRAERNKMAEANNVHLRAQAELAAADEFDIDAQRRIEEAIRQERVMENLEHAMEYSPESFGRVTMLYVDCKVNGTDVKAFVDSGAQATIMSPECAERCGIMRLLDTRFAGIARGVGTAKILGRVHSAQIQLGPTLFLPCSFTIMEGKGVEMLFGLDMLKRYQANIDLSQNSLIIQGTNIRFLDEHELPSEAKVEYEVDENGQPVPSAPKATATGAGALGAASANANAAAADAAAKSSTFPGAGQSLGAASGSGTSGPGQPRAAPESYGFSFSHPSSVSSTAAAAPIPAAAATGIAPPAAQASAAASGSRGGASKWRESSIASLMDLGASRVQAIGFLDAAGGNVEVAASLLFQQ